MEAQTKQIELMNYLQNEVDEIKENDGIMDKCSWPYQSGILISGNDAELIIASLQIAEGKEIPAGAEEILRKHFSYLDEMLSEKGMNWIINAMEEYAQIKVKEAMQSNNSQQRVEYFSKGQLMEILGRYTETINTLPCIEAYKYTSIVNDILSLVVESNNLKNE